MPVRRASTHNQASNEDPKYWSPLRLIACLTGNCSRSKGLLGYSSDSVVVVVVISLIMELVPEVVSVAGGQGGGGAGVYQNNRNHP